MQKDYNTEKRHKYLKEFQKKYKEGNKKSIKSRILGEKMKTGYGVKSDEEINIKKIK